MLYVMKNRRTYLAAIFSLFALSVFSLFFSCINIAGSGDVDEAIEISEFIKSHYDIKPEDREGLSGYHSPGPYSTKITIYRMLSEDDQNKLIDLLKSEKKKRGWKAITISFYEKESFIRTETGRKRWQEKLLRTETII
jgi:hypothetical protein